MLPWRDVGGFVTTMFSTVGGQTFYPFRLCTFPTSTIKYRKGSRVKFRKFSSTSFFPFFLKKKPINGDQKFLKEG